MRLRDLFPISDNAGAMIGLALFIWPLGLTLAVAWIIVIGPFWLMFAPRRPRRRVTRSPVRSALR